MADEPPASMKAYVEDPELDEVKPDDKALVKDVISVLSALQHPARVCKGWSVKPFRTTHYDVTGFIDTKNGWWEITYQDLDLVRSLDYARIGNVSLWASGPSAEIRVRVLSHTERVMVTECDILRVRKRMRLFE